MRCSSEGLPDVSVSFCGVEVREAQNQGRNEKCKIQQKRRDGQEVGAVHCVQVQGGIRFRQDTKQHVLCG